MSLPANLPANGLSNRDQRLLMRSHNRNQLATVIQQQEIINRGIVAETELGVLMRVAHVAGQLGTSVAKDLTAEAGTNLAAQRFVAAALSGAEAGVMRIVGGMA
ncbi:MAG TPA: hypothetical protein VHD87_15700 [Acidimicrobiales bacterium]|nr:hypothetical protein [Acidimicrobiales bacterium]